MEYDGVEIRVGEWVLVSTQLDHRVARVQEMCRTVIVSTHMFSPSEPSQASIEENMWARLMSRQDRRLQQMEDSDTNDWNTRTQAKLSTTKWRRSLSTI